MNHEILFFDESHTYLVDGEEVPSVTTILNYMSDVEYRGISPAVLDQAAKRGTLVHEYTELLDYDALPDEIEYEVVGYIKAYADFLRDYKPDWLLIETPVYSEHHGYAGTVDRFGIIDGKKSVVDIKTVASPTKMQKFTVSSQTSAYEMAIAETYRPGETRRPDRRYALYLGKDGDYNLVDLNEYDEKYGYDSWHIFKKCLDFYKVIQILKGAKPIRKE